MSQNMIQAKQVRNVKLPPLMLGTSAPPSRAEPGVGSTKNSNPDNQKAPNQEKLHDLTSDVLGIGMNEEAKSSERASSRRVDNKVHVQQTQSLGISSILNAMENDQKQKKKNDLSGLDEEQA
ncbi:hypothetical protein FGO68_gene17632 [Halteria grandinella]|uniref:Uncharacterized protein n=1 Tax=Halteria grandinella TaxID=5974 RepID=A0A8J8NLD5_HALGN|nr:hypothetical protein FGO68_gene17632 [Halteria grandinella]